MEAVVFEASVEDGTIRVPEQHLDRLRGPVRVIVLTDEEVSGEKDLIGQLLESPRRIEGFKPLARQELYEQQAAE